MERFQKRLASLSTEHVELLQLLTDLWDLFPQCNMVVLRCGAKETELTFEARQSSLNEVRHTIPIRLDDSQIEAAGKALQELGWKIDPRDFGFRAYRDNSAALMARLRAREVAVDPAPVTGVSPTLPAPPPDIPKSRKWV